jgi:hypothetical protein
MAYYYGHRTPESLERAALVLEGYAGDSNGVTPVPPTQETIEVLLKMGFQLFQHGWRLRISSVFQTCLRSRLWITPFNQLPGERQ